MLRPRERPNVGAISAALNAGKWALLGYRSALVGSTEEALAVLQEQGDTFDVVFSDIVMPGMGGIELASRLRRDRPDLPVILASGYSHVLAEDSAHGFTLIQKPYSADQLSSVLETALRS